MSACAQGSRHSYMGIHCPVGGLGITREEADFAAIWLARRGSGRLARLRVREAFCTTLARGYKPTPKIKLPCCTTGSPRQAGPVPNAKVHFVPAGGLLKGLNLDG